MSDGNEDWPALREAIRADRKRQGLSIQQAATKAKITRQTWSKIESGPNTTFEEYVLGRVEGALGWAPQTIDAILAGERARPLADVEAEMRAIADNPNRTDPLRKQARAVLELIDAVRAANVNEGSGRRGSSTRTA